MTALLDFSLNYEEIELPPIVIESSWSGKSQIIEAGEKISVDLDLWDFSSLLGLKDVDFPIDKLAVKIVSTLNALLKNHLTRQDLSGQDSITVKKYWTFVRGDKQPNIKGANVYQANNGFFVERDVVAPGNIKGSITFNRASDRFGWPSLRDTEFTYRVDRTVVDKKNVYVISIINDSPLADLLFRFYFDAGRGNVLMRPISPHVVSASNRALFFWWTTPPDPMPRTGAAFLTDAVRHPGTEGSKLHTPFVEFIKTTIDIIMQEMSKELGDLSIVYVSGKRGIKQKASDYNIDLPEGDAYQRAVEFMRRVAVS